MSGITYMQPCGRCGGLGGVCSLRCPGLRWPPPGEPWWMTQPPEDEAMFAARAGSRGLLNRDTP